jgi:DNA-binding phage protein
MVSSHLRTEEEMALYVQACIEEADGDSEFVKKAFLMLPGQSGSRMFWAGAVLHS